MNKPKLSPLSALLAVATVAGMTPAFAASTSYQSEVLTDNPYLNYQLGESSGTAATDASGNSRTGSYVNSPTLGVAGFGTGDTATTFSSASSQDVLTSNALGFGQLLDGSSFEFVLSTTTTTRGERLFGTYNDGATTGIDIGLNENGVGNALLENAVRLYIRDESGVDYGATFQNADLFDGNYHHVVLTYDSTNGLLGYVDGVAQTITVGNTGAAATFTSDFDYDPTLAARNVRGVVGSYLDGTLDEFALYDTVLTAQQVTDHYNALTVIPEPSTYALLAGSLALCAIMIRRRK